MVAGQESKRILALRCLNSLRRSRAPTTRKSYPVGVVRYADVVDARCSDVHAVPITHDDLCHPILNSAPFTREGWIFELKHDGFRALARTGTPVQLLSRAGRSTADAFPE